MQKYLLKILIILFLFSLLSLNIVFVYAEPTTTNTSEEIISENSTTENNEPSNDDIHTETTNNHKVQQSSVDKMDITSVKNINGLPEANLELNNILNIILIAIGILLILLAIALLIRIGKK